MVMKKSIKKILLVAIAIFAITVPMGVGANAKEAKAATVKVSTKKKVRVKNYKLKKKAKRKTVRTQTSTKTNIHTTKSIAAKVVKKTVTKVEKKTITAKKKKQIRTTTTVRITTTTNSYARSGSARVGQIKGIDNRVVKAFNNSGFKIETNPNSSILKRADGVFSPSNKKIVLKYNVDRLLAHELGHFVSYDQNGAANTNQWNSIYNAERRNFNGSADDSYETSKATEFFAGAFAEYTMNPSGLKRTCPRAYDYVAKTVKNM